MTLSPARFFIDGHFRTTDNVEPVVEAATGEFLGGGAAVSESEIDEAVAAARSALPGWQTSSPQHRAEILTAMAAELKSRARPTSELVTRENGMPISLSRGANGSFPQLLFRYYAQLVTEVPVEEIRPSITGHTIVRREAVGVVGVPPPPLPPPAAASPAWVVGPMVATVPSSSR